MTCAGAAGLKNGDDEGQSARTHGTSLDTWHRSLRTPHVLLRTRSFPCLPNKGIWQKVRKGCARGATVVQQ